MEAQDAVGGLEKRKREEDEEEEEPLRRGQPPFSPPHDDAGDDADDEEKVASEKTSIKALKADDVDDDDRMMMVMRKLRELEVSLPPPPAKPLPAGEWNWPDLIWTGNHMLLFDDYPTGIDFEQLIHPKFRANIWRYMVVNSERSRHAFFEFDRHARAEAFLLTFSEKQIPGTDLTYHLSWAPFVYFSPPDPYIYTSDEDSSEVENRRIAWESYWSTICEEEEERKEEEEEEEEEEDSEDSMPEQDNSCSAKPASYPVGLEQSYNMNGKRDKWWTEHLDIALPEEDDEPEVIQAHRPFESTIVFLGGLDSKVTKEDLNRIFEPLAPAKVKIYARRNCGYMEFHTMDDAQKAIKCLKRLWAKRKFCQPMWGKKRVEGVPDMLEN